jgi:hypothetical protein
MEYYASLVDIDCFNVGIFVFMVLFNVDNIVTLCIHLWMQTIHATSVYMLSNVRATSHTRLKALDHGNVRALIC